MKILDAYILKKFLVTFFFVVLVLIAILIVIDLTEKVEDFVKTKADLWSIITRYYLNFIPYYANMLSPITVFIATVFVTANLASHTEIVAILSSGVSFKRFMVPYIIGACLIGLLTFFLINWIIPNSNKVRIDFENQYLKSQFYFEARNVHMKISANTYAYLESYDNVTNVGYKFTLEHIEGIELKTKLSSPRIEWMPEKKKWHIAKYTIHSFQGMQETHAQGENMDTTLKLKPDDFGNNYMMNEKLTLPELNRYINQLKDRGAENVETYLIEKYLRFTYPFAILLLTVIGVIVSARKSRQGVGAQIAFGFALAIVYLLFFIMSRTVAQAGSIPPLIAVWLPNIIFSIIGVVLYKTVPR